MWEILIHIVVTTVYNYLYDDVKLYFPLPLASFEVAGPAVDIAAMLPSFGPAMPGNPPFWKTKTLAEMTREEWEQLCDGCGRCCLNKLEDEDTGRFLYTRAACKLLDLGACRCTDYGNRTARVPDCVSLTPENVGSLGWLPRTCAYRLLDEGKPLPWWHPLVSGRAETVREAGISVAEEAYSEEGLTADDLVDHIWKLPKARRRVAG